MRTQIMTVLMALILSACASHHRDVASVEPQVSEETQDQQARADGISPRGGDTIR